MTYFGHFHFWLLFLNLKLRCPGIRKKQETYVAGGGGGCSELQFFGNSPRPITIHYNKLVHENHK